MSSDDRRITHHVSAPPPPEKVFLRCFYIGERVASPQASSPPLPPFTHSAFGRMTSPYGATGGASSSVSSEKIGPEEGREGVWGSLVGGGDVKNVDAGVCK